MNCRLPKKKPINVFQARIYSITDEIASKITFSDMDEAKEYVFSTFHEEGHGNLMSRGVIRCIDPYLRMWIVPWGVDNEDALLADEDAIVSDEWRLSFYDMGDNILSTSYTKKSPEIEVLNRQMLCLNAFYCVVSCHESGMPRNRFVMCRTHRNKKFHITLVNPNPKSVELLPSETMEQRYAHLLKQDAAENMRINFQRWFTE